MDGTLSISAANFELFNKWVAIDGFDVALGRFSLQVDKIKNFVSNPIIKIYSIIKKETLAIIMKIMCDNEFECGIDDNHICYN